MRAPPMPPTGPCTPPADPPPLTTGIPLPKIFARKFRTYGLTPLGLGVGSRFYLKRVQGDFVKRFSAVLAAVISIAIVAPSHQAQAAPLSSCISIASAGDEGFFTSLVRYQVQVVSTCTDTPDLSYVFSDGSNQPIGLSGLPYSGYLRWRTLGSKQGLVYDLTFTVPASDIPAGVYLPTIRFSSTSLLASGEVTFSLPSYRAVGTGDSASVGVTCRKKAKNAYGKRPIKSFTRLSCPKGWTEV
jgi:hypothetical protein